MKNKPTNSYRSLKISDQIQRDLAQIIQREIKDSRLGLVTLQNVDVSPDYSHAKIFFSVLAGDKNISEKILNDASGFLQKTLFKRWHLHRVPNLHFIYDETTENADKINQLINRALKDSKD